MDEEEIPIEAEAPEPAKPPGKEPDYYDDPEDYAAVPDELDYEPPNSPMNSSTS